MSSIMKYIAFILSISLHIVKSFSQELPKTVCGICGTRENQITINSLSQEYEREGPLFYQLVKIKRLFGETYSDYMIRTIGGNACAYATYFRVPLQGQIDAYRAITINVDHYSSIIENHQDLQTVYTFILTHELFHHKNGDMFYHNQSSQAENFRNELLADERGGYAVGKLHPDVDLVFFDRILPKIFTNRGSSLSHPGKLFRVLAAKAGWMRAKLEEADPSQHETIFEINNRKYKIGYLNGNRAYGAINLDGEYEGEILIDLNSIGVFFGERINKPISYNGISYDKFSLRGAFIGLNANYRFRFIYLGEMSMPGLRPNGKGSIFTVQGDSYIGQWVNGQRNGFGEAKYSKYGFDGYTKYHVNEKEGKYRGQWSQNKKNGLGKWYNEKGDVLKDGCWKNDIYIGKNCN